MKKLMNLFTDEEGATAVEYSIMVVAIAAVIVATVYALGGKVHNMFITTNTVLN